MKTKDNSIKNLEEEIKFLKKETKELNQLIKESQKTQNNNQELLLEIKNRDSIIKYLEAMLKLSKSN